MTTTAKCPDCQAAVALIIRIPQPQRRIADHYQPQTRQRLCPGAGKQVEVAR
jgi:endogenous inhibitor of DNA gyrase (YacG/DUF329 family)